MSWKIHNNDAHQMDTNELLKVLESKVVEQGCPTDQEFCTPCRIAHTKLCWSVPHAHFPTTTNSLR